MTASELAKALGGHRAGAAWMARCPAHEDHTPSLSISDATGGRVLVRCHAGCQQETVIATLRECGLWAQQRTRPTTQLSRRASAAGNLDPGEGRRTQAALRVWDCAKPATGTLIETYLASRGIHLAPSASLRFHPQLKHPSGGHWPAMVAVVTNGTSGSPIAIHRTYLARDGGGKAPVEPERLMLGPCRGGVVRLAKPGGVLMVGEGVETCLAAMQASGHPAWAALSTSGLRSLELPTDVRDVIVLADGDVAGEAAATNCAQRWRHQGRRVCVARPPRGLDFNDLLVRHESIVTEGAL